MGALQEAPTSARDQQHVVARIVPVERFMPVLIGWHVLLATGALLVAAVVQLTDTGPGGTIGLGLTVVAGIFAVAAASAIPLLRRGEHRGRVMSLVTTYLLLVGSTFQLLQTAGIFRGLDAVGASMGNAVPGLAVMAVGLVILSSERLPERFRRHGRTLLLVGGAITLLLLGILPGLLEFAIRVVQPETLPWLVLAVGSALIVHRTWQIDVARHFDASADQLELLDGLLFLSPNLIGFVVFFAGPLLFSLVISFFAWDALGDRSFLGLDNYVRILALDVSTDGTFAPGYSQALSLGPIDIGARDPIFWTAIGNVLQFTLLALPASIVPAVFLAIALDSDVPGIKAFRAVFFVPSVAGVVAVALIWKQLFNATSGYLNYIIERVVVWLDSLPGISATDPSIQWLSDADVALYSLVIVFAWQYLGFNTVLFLAGLQGIKKDLYEAAAIDGAGWWARFRHITIPQLAPTTFFVVATTGILTLQLFGEAVVLFPTNQPIGSGPANSTITPVVYLYDQGFRRFSQGYASAVAWVLFALIFVFTYIQFRRQRDEAEA